MPLDDYFEKSRNEIEFDYSTFDPIREALEHDQCHHGMRNINEAILHWLLHCAPEGRKALLRDLIELDEELNGFGR